MNAELHFEEVNVEPSRKAESGGASSMTDYDLAQDATVGEIRSRPECHAESN